MTRKYRNPEKTYLLYNEAQGALNEMLNAWAPLTKKLSALERSSDSDLRRFNVEVRAARMQLLGALADMQMAFNEAQPAMDKQYLAAVRKRTAR